MAYRNWLQRLIFGVPDDKHDRLIKSLDEATEESRQLREELREIAKLRDPLSRLASNMRRSQFHAQTDQRRGNDA